MSMADKKCRLLVLLLAGMITSYVSAAVDLVETSWSVPVTMKETLTSAGPVSGMVTLNVTFVDDVTCEIGVVNQDSEEKLSFEADYAYDSQKGAIQITLAGMTEDQISTLEEALYESVDDGYESVYDSYEIDDAECYLKSLVITGKVKEKTYLGAGDDGAGVAAAMLTWSGKIVYSFKGTCDVWKGSEEEGDYITRNLKGTYSIAFNGVIERDLSGREVPQEWSLEDNANATAAAGGWGAVTDTELTASLAFGDKEAGIDAPGMFLYTDSNNDEFSGTCCRQNGKMVLYPNLSELHEYLWGKIENVVPEDVLVDGVDIQSVSAVATVKNNVLSLSMKVKVRIIGYQDSYNDEGEDVGGDFVKTGSYVYVASGGVVAE